MACLHVQTPAAVMTNSSLTVLTWGETGGWVLHFCDVAVGWDGVISCNPPYKRSAERRRLASQLGTHTGTHMHTQLDWLRKQST